MYDAVIIGAGPAGYVCALSLAKQGAKVCVIEKDSLGGTCTNKGCIPTKYLHSVGDIVRKTKSAKKFGINTDVSIDYSVLNSKIISKSPDMSITGTLEAVVSLFLNFFSIFTPSLDNASIRNL
jgi:dihydrolipoamide dehydrogenase